MKEVYVCPIDSGGEDNAAVHSNFPTGIYDASKITVKQNHIVHVYVFEKKYLLYMLHQSRTFQRSQIIHMISNINQSFIHSSFYTAKENWMTTLITVIS